MGAVIALTALALTFHVDERFTTALPGYTDALQEHVERTDRAQRELAKLTGARRAAFHPRGGLSDYGVAPSFRKIDAWINSPRLTMRALRGKVVLVDFWTYSCINCLRTLPHLKAWDARYRKDGLVIVGVHTPEFAFEHSLANVRSATKRLGVEYPVALDNSYGTWNAYANQFWPAEYLIDRRGHVRRVHFGEGKYAESERAIRTLLGERGGRLTRVADTTPRTLTTPETYLGAERTQNYAGSPLRTNQVVRYRFPRTLGQNAYALSGQWNVENERAVPVRDARLRLHYVARKVYLVLGGRGSVDVLVDGRREKTVRVDKDKLYTLVDTSQLHEAVLELRFSPGVAGYAFTFG
jgi:thiol-disulfide isomerase/thioredoxin